MPVAITITEALRAVGRSEEEPPVRPAVLSGPGGTVVPIVLLGPGDRADWRGFWISASGEVRFVGAPAPEASLPHPDLPPATAALLDLLLASTASLLEQVAALDDALATLPIGDELVSLRTVESTHRRLLFLRRHVGRLAAIVAELEGPLGRPFHKLPAVYDEIARSVDRLRALTHSVESTLRDIVMIRSSFESNRISDAANRLGATSNRIGVLATNSNIRMLGIAYLALVIALVAAALIVPETVATVLSMPSAGWVPGAWVVVLLVLSTAVPLGMIFTRPWLRGIVRGLGSFERASAEGMQDMAELSDGGRPLPSAPNGSPPRRGEGA